MTKFKTCIYIIFTLVILTPLTAYPQELNIVMKPIDDYLTGEYVYDISFDTLIEYIQSGDIQNLLDYLKNIIFNRLKTELVYHNIIMYTIMLICVVSVILRTTGNEKFKDIYGQIFVSSASVLLIQIYADLYSVAENVIDNLAGFMGVSLPVYFGISASITDKLPFSVFGVFTIFVSLFRWGTLSLIMPAISVSSMLGISENICLCFDTAGIRKFINSAVNWLLGLYTTFFVAVLKLTQICAFGTDRLVMSGVRYTLSRSIPVVGGFLSEVAGAIITSTLILHNAVGIGCVIVIAMIAVLPFIILMIISFILKFTASLLSGIAYKNLCNVILCFGESICELAVIMLCGCVTFIIGIGIQFSLGR
jgi:stage III sporulation protein AE